MLIQRKQIISSIIFDCDNLGFCSLFFGNLQVSYYSRGDFSHNSLIDALRSAIMKSNPSRSKALPIFLSTTIDTPLIQSISDYDTFINTFHYGWRRDSRPRMVLIKPLTLPPLRYCVAAFRAADHLAAGYINSEPGNNHNLARNFNVNPNEVSPSVCVYLCICI